MTVKVNDRDRTIGTVDAPQQGQGDGVVAAERDDARQCLAFEGGSPLVRVRGGFAGEDAVVAFFDLVEREGVVVSDIIRGNVSSFCQWGSVFQVRT